MSEETTTTSSEQVVTPPPTKAVAVAAAVATTEVSNEEKIPETSTVDEESNESKVETKGNEAPAPTTTTLNVGEKRPREEDNVAEGASQQTESSGQETTETTESTIKETEVSTTPSTSVEEPPAKKQNVSSDTVAAVAPAAATDKIEAAYKPIPKQKIALGVPTGVPTGDPSELHLAASMPTTEKADDDGVVEEKDTVPTMYVGRVIGKGGEMIRDLQARSGCRIDVDQNVPAGAPRIITYRGSSKTVEFAKQLVALLCQSSADRSSNEDQLPLGAATRKHLVVPTSVIGKIIGRGGEMIRELQGKSGAKIQVDHSGAGGVDPTMRQVTVTGTDPSVVKADEMIRFLIANPAMDAMAAIAMLIKDKATSGNHWGSGPPYPNLPNNGANMAGRDGYGLHNNHNHNNNNYNSYNSGSSSNNHYQSPPESEIFPCAKMYMGRVIGQKGVTINDLQKRSGCDIQINQDVSPGHDCEITIKGTRQGIETAKSMLTEIIQLGPQHPYAGGQSRHNNNNRNHNNNFNNNHHQTSYGNYHQQPQQQPQQPQQQQQQHALPNNYATNYLQNLQHQQPHQNYAPQQQSYAPPTYANNTNAYAPNPVYAQQPPPQQHQPPPATPVAAPVAYSAYTSNYVAQPPQQPPTYAPPQQQPPQQQPIPQQPPQQAQQLPVYYQQQQQQQQQQQPPPPYAQPTPQPTPANFPVWKTAQAPDGQTYYYNEKTGETSWDKPPGMP